MNELMHGNSCILKGVYRRIMTRHVNVFINRMYKYEIRLVKYGFPISQWACPKSAFRLTRLAVDNNRVM